MGSLFDRHKVLHGLPLPGQTVRYENPSKWAFFNEVLENEKLLKLDNFYTIKKTELNSSSTYFFLEEFWDDTIDENFGRQKFFNANAFRWDLPELDLSQLVGLDSGSVQKLYRTYDIGIKISDCVFCEGSPMLILEEDDRRIVKKAFWEE